MDEQPRRPLLRVVRGTPDDVELAALTAVVAGLASSVGGGETAPRPRSAWADPARRLRQPLRPGPGAWRASALPR
ncbi:Acyl-CoA carboxylase epsilon subunit [Streptoalloteichus tenebrarius]|uniref:Acyl-CoA carboxylase epsilon subunit n=1 Tax=Streptoalloteichus tenebrarius (strain ATCC 17920 / DSM 40477 / JCM 4838 / CBS 697.72 / NBRC 16177 / NCIMB 11028 / NRRL B-12390 / A12253. 1 / ISP 5477) TaxID=1933 RepID=A0ABT1HY52_STRSD|nr:acyl-CoA carboxylase subunit epsilon [Streptoalloteichus tenebrarius]MCP2260439.1 Acyl-CoA carboxylase epsilon subunit [Streptoalloteichus tenebrarius]